MKKLINLAFFQVMSEDTKLVLLIWAKDIFSKIKLYYNDLGETDELSALVSGITRAATDRCRKIALAAAKCIYLFVDNFNQTWKVSFKFKKKIYS